MARQITGRSFGKDISPADSSSGGILILAAGSTGGILEAAEPVLLSRRLNGRGKKVSLLSLDTTTDGRESDTGLLSKPIGYLTGHCSKLAQLWRTIPKYETTHIFPTSDKGLWSQLILPIILSRFFGKRVLLSYDGSGEELLAGHINALKMKLLASCDAVTVNSRGLSRGLQRRDINADFVYGVFDEDRLPHLDITAVTPRILVALPLERFHGLPCVIKAFKVVKQKYPRAELVISGQGRQAAALERAVTESKLAGVSVDTSGDEDSFYRHLSQSDVLVNTSALDYVPGSVLAAMAAGLPVVSTEHPSTQDLVKDRVSGLFFEVNDHQALSDRLIELVESPELVRSLTSHGRQSASRYGWDCIENQWRRLYNS